MSEEKAMMSGAETQNRETLPLITIIVPVYQVKEYIGECVESLLAQNYTNLEILLVNDGSTDGSGELCDEYARRDNRIRVLHQENQGAAGARNTGLDHAEGEYVAFVDSDDEVSSNYIEELYKLIGKYRADIAACAFEKNKVEKVQRKGKTVNDSSVMEVCMSSEQMLRQWHGKYKDWETTPCNKLYHRSILEGDGGSDRIRFPMGRRHEDVLISHLIIANANRIVLTTQKLYMYRTRPGSCTTQILVTAENRKQNLRAQRERMAFFRKRRYWRAYLNLLIGYVLHLGWFAWKRMKPAMQK